MFAVVESTSVYHFPVVSYLQENGIFVSVVNPLIIKKYASMDIRKVKTDKADSLKLASYVLDNYRHLVNYSAEDEIYSELRFLSRQYLVFGNKFTFTHTCNNITMPKLFNKIT